MDTETLGRNQRNAFANLHIDNVYTNLSPEEVDAKLVQKQSDMVSAWTAYRDIYNEMYDFMESIEPAAENGHEVVVMVTGNSLGRVKTVVKMQKMDKDVYFFEAEARTDSGVTVDAGREYFGYLYPSKDGGNVLVDDNGVTYENHPEDDAISKLKLLEEAVEPHLTATGHTIAMLQLTLEDSYFNPAFALLAREMRLDASLLNQT